MQVAEPIAEAGNVVDGFWVIVGGLGKINPFAKAEVAIVEAAHAVEVPVVDLVVWPWHPVLAFRHLFTVHLEPAVCREP
jgi:hypothetical protein